MNSDNVQEMPEGWLQPFEKFPELTHFVLQMASSGMIPRGSGWTSFLYELNEVCKKASIEGEKGPRWVKADISQNWKDRGGSFVIKSNIIDRYKYDVTNPATIIYWLQQGKEIYFLQEESNPNYQLKCPGCGAGVFGMSGRCPNCGKLLDEEIPSTREGVNDLNK